MPQTILYGSTTQDALEFGQDTTYSSCSSCGHNVWFSDVVQPGKVYLCPYCTSLEEVAGGNLYP